jgi:endonuclease G
VDNKSTDELTSLVRQRLAVARPQIIHSIANILSGNPLAAEPSKDRRIGRLQAKASISRSEAEMYFKGVDSISTEQSRATIGGPESVIGPTLDFLGIAFLELGRRAADAVARVAFRNGGPQGSGFLVAPGLFITNHHVISSPADATRFVVEFDYEYDAQNNLRDVTRFALKPEHCFVTSGIESLDFTLIGLGERISGNRDADEYGFIPLSDAHDKHMLGETANLIQHPQGRFKEIVLRENHLVSRDETIEVLHYIADTEQGSSGSPVFNNDWEAIALHHWGGPYHEVASPDGTPLNGEINEGIRISAIVRALRREAKRAGASSARIAEAVRLWDSFERPVPVRVNRHATGETVSSPPNGSKIHADGSVTWTFPIEINVRAPLLTPTIIPGPSIPRAEPKSQAVGTAEATTWKNEDFSDRGGYEPGFIPGHVVPLPQITGDFGRVALNSEAVEGDDPQEFPYHHFSIKMNAERRLAYFTACNIDGARIKAINRDDKTVVDNPSLSDLGVESIGAEASDAFRPDRRLPTTEQMTREFYESQVVAGYPIPTDKGRIARMFQKGHITLRGDPAWGTKEQAVAAERDTFFYTNAAPQLGFFNQGSALNRPGSKGKLRWRAIESFVLRNTVTMRSRVNVFAGPVFSDQDIPYRQQSLVPKRFWKIAVWAQGGQLRSIALLADQGAIVEFYPEGIGAEGFADSEELARVSEFLTTVAHVESLTGLDFGVEIRAGDLRAGEARERIAALDFEPVDLEPKTQGMNRVASNFPRRRGARPAKK